MTETGRPETGTGHCWIDARSLDLARIVVAWIDAEPSLIRVAHENLNRWSRRPGGLGLALLEWLAILTRPWSEVREVLLDESDVGQRVRSSSPFVGIITEDERAQIIARHSGPPPVEPFTRDEVDEELVKRILDDNEILADLPNANDQE